MDKMITDKMTIDLNVFSLFMEDIIVSNMKATVIFGLMLKATVKFSIHQDITIQLPHKKFLPRVGSAFISELTKPISFLV